MTVRLSFIFRLKKKNWYARNLLYVQIKFINLNLKIVFFTKKMFFFKNKKCVKTCSNTFVKKKKKKIILFEYKIKSFIIFYTEGNSNIKSYHTITKNTYLKNRRLFENNKSRSFFFFYQFFISSNDYLNIILFFKKSRFAIVKFGSVILSFIVAFSVKIFGRLSIETTSLCGIIELNADGQ